MFQATMILAGIAGALILAGGAGVVAAMRGAALGVQQGLSLLGSGFGLGLGLALAYEMLERRADKVPERWIREAEAWERKLRCQEREAELEARAQTAPPPPDEDSAWYPVLRAFFTNGQRAEGFSHTRLEKTMSEDAWTDLTTFYASDAGRRLLRLDSAKGYVWNYAVNLDAVMPLLTAHSLPHPKGAPPQIAPWTPDATRRDTRRQKATVVEGQAKVVE